MKKIIVIVFFILASSCSNYLKTSETILTTKKFPPKEKGCKIELVDGLIVPDKMIQIANFSTVSNKKGLLWVEGVSEKKYSVNEILKNWNSKACELGGDGFVNFSHTNNTFFFATLFKWRKK